MSNSVKAFIIMVVVLIACGLVWYLNFYKPDLLKVKSFKKESQKLMAQLQSFKVTDQQIDALQTQVDKLRDEILITNAKIIPKDKLTVVVQQIRSNGREFGLKFIQVIPDFKSLITAKESEKAPAEMVRLPVHMKIQGYYKSFGQFVDSLNELPFYISVGEVVIMYNQNIHPKVDILVDMILYLKGIPDLEINI